MQNEIQGHYQIYIPQESLRAEKITYKAHKRTMHGGVILTKATIRENYWILKLRQIAKKVIRNSFRCKRFHTAPFMTQQQRLLPTERTTGTRPFQVIGKGFASPFMYRNKNRGGKKAYIILFTCSLTKVIHLELLPYQITDDFIRALKRLIAKRVCPETIYSDDAKTYVVVSEWIKKISKTEILHQVLSTRLIKWKFNLSRVPWWGEQFGRMVCLVKNRLYKTVGKLKLEWKVLEELLTNIEGILNNGLLTYIEEDN